jgi:sterol desaturase/sphingolipid hydroxylase (fatty acid hydroxylase superfamily)
MEAYTLIILLAIPVFFLGMAVELLVLRRRRRPGYDTRDSVANVLSSVGSLLISLPFSVVEIALLLWMNDQVPWRLTGWVAWVVALVAVDFTYYWYHRTHHEIRALWAVHSVHHSSRRYDLSVALRQTWVVFTTLPFLVPVALLGVDAKIVLSAFVINLVYQFFIHTEVVGRLWRPVEFVFNTPSHHRVHHGANAEYLDRNYGGILIVWDRLFGTFEPERARVVYGLTKNIDTYNVLRIEVHEFVAIWRDVRAARTWRDRFGHVFRGPGWQPAPTPALVALPA